MVFLLQLLFFCPIDLYMVLRQATQPWRSLLFDMDLFGSSQHARVHWYIGKSREERVEACIAHALTRQLTSTQVKSLVRTQKQLNITICHCSQD